MLEEGKEGVPWVEAVQLMDDHCTLLGLDFFKQQLNT